MVAFNSEYSKIQELFKALEWFSSMFQDRVNFQGLVKNSVHIQVLFKPVLTHSTINVFQQQ